MINGKGFDRQRYIDFLLDNNVFTFEPTSLSSGRESQLYANFRFDDVYLTNMLAGFIIDFAHAQRWEDATFVGVPEGVTNLGSITQNRWAQLSPNYGPGSHALPMIRAVPKTHGKLEDREFVGGIPPSGSVLIENVTTTAESLYRYALKLRVSGVHNLRTLTLVDRSVQDAECISEARKKMVAGGFSFDCLTNVYEFLPVLCARDPPDEEVIRRIESEYAHGGRKLHLKNRTEVF